MISRVKSKIKSRPISKVETSIGIPSTHLPTNVGSFQGSQFKSDSGNVYFISGEEEPHSNMQAQCNIELSLPPQTHRNPFAIVIKDYERKSQDEISIEMYDNVGLVNRCGPDKYVVHCHRSGLTGIVPSYCLSIQEDLPQSKSTKDFPNRNKKIENPEILPSPKSLLKTIKVNQIPTDENKDIDTEHLAEEQNKCLENGPSNTFECESLNRKSFKIFPNSLLYELKKKINVLDDKKPNAEVAMRPPIPETFLQNLHTPSVLNSKSSTCYGKITGDGSDSLTCPLVHESDLCTIQTPSLCEHEIPSSSNIIMKETVCIPSRPPPPESVLQISKNATPLETQTSPYSETIVGDGSDSLTCPLVHESDLCTFQTPSLCEHEIPPSSNIIMKETVCIPSRPPPPKSVLQISTNATPLETQTAPYSDTIVGDGPESLTCPSVHESDLCTIQTPSLCEHEIPPSSNIIMFEIEKSDTVLSLKSLSTDESISERLDKSRRPVWLLVTNLGGVDDSTVKEGDLVRLLVEDKKSPDQIPADDFLECETWCGEPIVLPRESVRVVVNRYELTSLLSRRPRAQVRVDFIRTCADELSVHSGEVVYLFREDGPTHFFASNKMDGRGRVPKEALKVLVYP